MLFRAKLHASLCVVFMDSVDSWKTWHIIYFLSHRCLRPLFIRILFTGRFYQGSTNIFFLTHVRLYFLTTFSVSSCRVFRFTIDFCDGSISGWIAWNRLLTSRSLFDEIAHEQHVTVLYALLKKNMINGNICFIQFNLKTSE